MARLFLVHWNKLEALELIRPLRDAGHSVRYHYDDGAEAWALLKETPPDALVISLARLPSHGRRVAAVTTEFKKLRDLPVVFVDGEREKVAVARKEFPRSEFTTAEEMVHAIERALARPSPTSEAAPAPRRSPTRKAARRRSTAASAGKQSKVRSAPRRPKAK